MKTLICLVRHGQTDWNKQSLIQGRIDNPLNEFGRLSTRTSAQKIIELNVKWDKLLSSPLKRAYETASIIKNEIKYEKEIITINDLTERDFGELEGKKVGPESYKLMNTAIPGLESLQELQERATRTIKEIAAKFPNENILVATHSQFIKGLLSAIIKDFDLSCLLRNNSLTIVQVIDGNIEVLSYEL